MSTAKDKWYQAEQIACDYIVEQWYKILSRNFTVVDSEIDIIAESDEERLFIEVKSVSMDTDLFDYITASKISAMKRGARTYNLRHPTDKQMRLDVLFIADGKIREHCEHISFYQ